MDRKIMEGLVKGAILMFGFPALIMIIWNWQFEDILVVNYWQIFWVRIIIEFLFYEERNK